jgi:hypothetical protein
VEFCVRYKVWRSNKDKSLHLLCGEGSEVFNALPVAVGWAHRVMPSSYSD